MGLLIAIMMMGGEWPQDGDCVYSGTTSLGNVLSIVLSGIPRDNAQCAGDPCGSLRRQRQDFEAAGGRLLASNEMWDRWLAIPQTSMQLQRWASRVALAKAFSISVAGAPPYQFLSLSISHSRQFAVAAALVSCSQAPHAVGIDLEPEGRPVAHAILSRVAHPQDDAGEASPLARWCAKEAALKTVSNGKAIPLSEIWLRHVAPGSFRFGREGYDSDGIATQISLPGSMLYVGEAPMPHFCAYPAG